MINENNDKRKAFTIIELMAVLIIIAILATLVITSVTSYKERLREEYINSLVNQVKLAAKDYYSDNPTELPRGQIVGNEKIYNTYVMASTLQANNNFTNELVDENGKDCSTESYVVVRNTNGNYNYEPCLICNGKVLNEGEYCKINGNQVVNDTPYCSVNVENANQNVKKLTVQTNATNGVIESTIIAASDGSYYAYKPGTYTFTVQSANGMTAYCGVTIYMEEDISKPSCSASLVSSSNTSHKVKFSWSDGISLKSVTNPTNGSVYKNDYVCSYEKYSTTGAADFTFTRGSSDKTYTMSVTDCNGNSATCSYTVPKKTTSSGGSSGGGSICIGSGCNDDDNNEDTGCKTVCYAGASSDYDYSTCRYYQCSDDGCSGSWRKIPGCTEEEVNPDTGCFLEGTKVLTSNGYKNIEDVKIGDYVLSYNEETKENEYNRVYDTFIHKNNNEDLYEITIKGKVLKVTEAHRFYVKEKGSNDYVWKAVRHLNIGDILVDSNKEEHRISNINHYSHFGTVYNLTVENNYNYYVSDNNYLVHVHNGQCFTKQDNKCPVGSYEYDTFCCK